MIEGTNALGSEFQRPRCRGTLYLNKDKNVHIFALSAIRGELFERERKREKQRETKRRREGEKERARERKRGREGERERDQNILIKTKTKKV